MINYRDSLYLKGYSATETLVYLENQLLVYRGMEPRGFHFGENVIFFTWYRL